MFLYTSENSLEMNNIMCLEKFYELEGGANKTEGRSCRGQVSGINNGLVSSTNCLNGGNNSKLQLFY